MIRFRMLERRDDIAGADDLVAELALVPGVRDFVKWPRARCVGGDSPIRASRRCSARSDT